MIKYKVDYFDKIEKVEVNRESASSLWIEGKVCRKRTEWDNYFDTFELAHGHLLNKAVSGLERAEDNLLCAKEYYEKITKMKNPNNE